MPVMVMVLCVTGACGGSGQPAGGPQPAGQAATPPAGPQKSTARMATDIPAAITTPASVETRLGTLRFTDGFPDDATVEKVFDNWLVTAA